MPLEEEGFVRLGIPDGTKKLVSGVDGGGRKFTSLIDFSHVVIHDARVGVPH